MKINASENGEMCSCQITFCQGEKKTSVNNCTNVFK